MTSIGDDAGATGPGDSVSSAWLRDLRADGSTRELALDQLHAMLLRVARSEARRRGPQTGIAGPELDDLAHQAADDALLSITTKLQQFRGESRFTTWAYKFAVLEVSSKIGRHFWRRPAEQLDDEGWARLPDRFALDPADHTQWQGLVVAIRAAVDEHLTPRQRRVFVALVLQGIPLDTLVVQLDTNRNAIYKAMFDARRRLRAALAANGYLSNSDTSEIRIEEAR